MNRIASGALIVAYALGPMATQILTPAVPFVHRDFAIPMAAAQTLISLSFVTIGFMTLIYGPLSDRFGRRPMVLTGTGLFCTGSVVAFMAPTFEVLIVGRMIQAGGSAAGLVLTRTIIYDVYGYKRSGQVIAYLTTVMILVPMLSPAAGGALLDHVHWRAIFAVCVLFGVVAFSFLTLYLPETCRARRTEVRLRQSFQYFVSLLRDPHYLRPTLFFSCIMATFFAGQAAIPYLLVDVLGGSAIEYGVWFAVACVCYVAGNVVTARWGDRLANDKLIMLSGLCCLLTSIAGLVGASLLEWSTAVLFVPTLVLSFFGAIGIGPVQTQAVAAQPEHAGAASGLLSAMQMAIGAAVIQLVGFSHNGTPYPMFITFIGCTLVALLALGSARVAYESATSAPTGLTEASRY